MQTAKIRVTPLEKAVMLPLVRQGWKFWAVLGGLLAVVLWGTYAWTVQLNEGLAVTGMRDRISWGLYIGMFVFFIGVSYGGTLVSAILRLARAEWRKPITRIAEVTTAAALIVAGTMIFADLGRPDRAAHLLLYPRTESPLIWDMTVIALYLFASLIYLFLPLIPDLAILRDKIPRRHPLRRLYRWLAMEWRGHPGQHRRLERSLMIMTVLVIPLAIAAHTVTAWIFGMTLRVGWHSAILGPYFVVGAIFSGIATVILILAIIRRGFKLQKYIRPEHFQNLGLLLLVLNVALLYFTLSEYLTAGYGGEIVDVQWLTLLAEGPYAPMFWAMLLGGLIAPMFILIVTRARSVAWTVVASVLVNIGMWLERYLIVVPTLSVPQTPVEAVVYWPTWVELSVMSAAFAAFGLLLAVFARLFPVMSMWELAEEAPKPVPAVVPSEVTD